jgi:hypothetical protein
MAQQRAIIFLPCRLRRHSSRTKKIPSRRPPLRFGPQAGAPPLASVCPIAIEAAMVRAR